jgi:hypothetical protein
MGNTIFNISDLADITTSISEYHKLATIFTQLKGGKDGEPLREFWNRKVVKRETNTWLNSREETEWLNFNLHFIPQMWGNTSGGWEGIGGAAITESYSIIIENEKFGFAAIYYNGQLAYICEIDEKYKELIKGGYKNMPGVSSCSKVLTVIYKRNN